MWPPRPLRGTRVEIVIGSKAHRDLFCEVFVKTHVPYDPAGIDWPDLDDDQRQMLRSLPIWTESVNAEHETAVIVGAMADFEQDPVIAEAIAVQAYEEERHAVLVRTLTQRYDIAVDDVTPQRPTDPEIAFLRSGWGECLDSFFAFGIYEMARQMQLFPNGLIDLFDLVMQEEARHILFFENWRMYRLHQGGRTGELRFRLHSQAAAVQTLASRASFALSSSRRSKDDGTNFILAGAQAWSTFSPRTFLDQCLSENERRFASFDRRLLRPRVLPTIVRGLSVITPKTMIGRRTKHQPGDS
jgi:hypothetical protein